MENNIKDKEEENYLKAINKISTKEIEKVLNFYKNAQNYSCEFLTVSGISVGASFSLYGAGSYALGWLTAAAGFGKFFAVQEWMADGISIFLGGIGIGGVFGLLTLGAYYYFDKKINNKDKDIKEKKEFEDKLKDSNSLESKIFSSFLKKLSDNLSKKLKTLIKNEYNKMQEIVHNLNLESEEFYNDYGEKIITKAKESFKNFNKIEKISILVLGKAGVGKTTLINAILNKENKESHIGLPQQMDNSIIKNNNINLFPTLDIYDTRGIELSQDFSIENSSQQIINFIKNGSNKEDNNDKNPINFIHCIWYCITGARIEKAEIQYIEKLMEIYSSDKKLPIIFVYTQAIHKKYIQGIKDTLFKLLKDKDIKFLDVIAEPYTFGEEENSITLKKKGLKNLLNESLELCKLGIESAFYGNIFNSFKNLINHYLYIKPLQNTLESINQKTLSFYENKKSYSYINDQISDILLNNISKFFHDEKTYEESLSKIKPILDEFKKMMKNWYKKDFYELSNILNKDSLLSIINSSFEELYDELYKNKISEIPDYDILSVFDKNSYKRNIEYSLKSKKDKLIKDMNIIIENNIANKYIISSNFVIEYFSMEFFRLICEKIKGKANLFIQNKKKYLDSIAQETSKEIYSHIIKDINLDLINK